MFWLVSTLLLGIVLAGCVVTFIVSGSVPARRTQSVLVAGGTIVIWIILSIILSIHTVGQRQVGIVYNFSGTITGVKNPGVVMTAPWQHITTENVGVQRENFALDSNNAAVSSDQQAIYANLALELRGRAEGRPRALQDGRPELEGDPARLADPAGLQGGHLGIQRPADHDPPARAADPRRSRA